jgi:Fe-S cluster assembly protein SufB
LSGLSEWPDEDPIEERMALPNPALTQIPDTYKYGWHDAEQPRTTFEKGISAEVVAEISRIKGEPKWMTDRRLKAYRHFEARPLPMWGGDLTPIDFQDIYYYVTGSSDGAAQSWDDVPDYIRRTYDKLGIPEAEKKYLAGVGGQYDSEVIYHNIREDLEKQGVIFMGTDQALKEHPDLFREHFGTVIPANDNKLAALNTAVWSGGSFIYVPKGVHVELPLQAYFRINTENMGQFERTLIIAEEGSYVHYVEGCTAPIFTTDSLHSAVVEIIVKKGARVRYSTIQNWSNNVYNLVTKRAVAYQDAVMEWVDGNLGSKLTMKYPSVYLMEPGAHAEILSLAFAGTGQHQDAGGKVIHAAPNTTSTIVSKSISKGSGRTSYRGLVKVYPGCDSAASNVRCDALMLDEDSRSDTYPTMEIDAENVTIGHEATVGKLGEDQLFYLMARGIPEAEAAKMIVNGFVEPIVKELPMEYAVELNRLIELQMEGSVG